jgi:hypothetical protein
MKEYKISKRSAILIYITVPLLIALFVWILIIPFIPTMTQGNLNAYWFLAPISIAMIALLTVGLLDTIKSKFVIDSDKIFTVSTFSNRQLFLNEIKGYRITEKFIFIEPNDTNKKKIKVSTYFGNTNEIVAWLWERYPDLDIAQANRQKEEILNDEQLGATIEEREAKLMTARKTAKILNWTGVLIGVWAIFFPSPYRYAIIASVAFPIICLIALKYFRGLISIDEKKGSAYPTIILAIAASGMGLCIRALFDCHIFDYSNIWKPTVLILTSYMIILGIGNKKFKLRNVKEFIPVVAISIFIFCYGYGAIVTLNCIYDKSSPQAFDAKILNKRISSGKTTTYYFELTPWGPQTEIDEVSVSKELYSSLEKDQSVHIYFMKGRFNIPWYEMTE